MCGWTACRKAPCASYTFSNVTANHTIEATFKVATFVITPTAGANGTITPSTPQTVNYGASAAFTIMPNTGYVIDDVRVDGVSQGAIASYTFSNVTANHTIEATFKVATFVITPTAGAHGTITPGTPQTVNYGASAAFTITPNTGYVIDNVVVNGVSQGAITSYTFNNVTANGLVDLSAPITSTSRRQITPSSVEVYGQHGRGRAKIEARGTGCELSPHRTITLTVTVSGARTAAPRSGIPNWPSRACIEAAATPIEFYVDGVKARVRDGLRQHMAGAATPFTSCGEPFHRSHVQDAELLAIPATRLEVTL